MIPKNIDDYWPRGYERDEGLIALIDNLNFQFNQFKTETLGLRALIDPFQIPALLIGELGYFLNAGLKVKDSERQERVKVATAIQGHKKRGSFLFDAKPKIDNICGGDSVILSGQGNDDWIMSGDGTEPPGVFWAIMGGDGLTDDYGIKLIGAGDELEVAGNVYIDCDNPSLTTEQEFELRIDLDDIAPAYMRVIIGYVSGGVFTEYFRID